MVPIAPSRIRMRRASRSRRRVSTGLIAGGAGGTSGTNGGTASISVATVGGVRNYLWAHALEFPHAHLRPPRPGRLRRLRSRRDRLLPQLLPLVRRLDARDVRGGRPDLGPGAAREWLDRLAAGRRRRELPGTVLG